MAPQFSKIFAKKVPWPKTGGGGGLRSPKPEKIAVKLRKIAVNCGKIAVKIAVDENTETYSMPSDSKERERFFLRGKLKFLNRGITEKLR